MKAKAELWISKLIEKVSYFKMILLLLSFCIFSIIDAGKPIRWNPERHNFEEWPKSQVFIFHTKNPLDFDYPDCFGTLLTPSLVLTIASCFKGLRTTNTFFLMDNPVTIAKVTTINLYSCMS